MRFIFYILSALLAVAMFSGCNSHETYTSAAPPPPKETAEPKTLPSPTDGAARITAAELHDLYVKNKVFIIDTRIEDAYKQEHIKGAISVPVNDVLVKIPTFPHDKKIVAYCT
jgi:hypothetical protein